MSTSEVTRRADGVRAEEAQLGTRIFQQDLRDLDPEIVGLMQLEEERQYRKVILIASESIAPRAVRQAMDSPFANLYAEGLPGGGRAAREFRLEDLERHLAHFRRLGDRRYYRGCEYANFVESLAQRRAARLFATDGHDDSPARVSASEIFVNVQPLSGAAANNAVYTAFAKPGDVVMGMSLVSGGHLTHGSPVNRSGKHHRIVSYEIDRETGRIDYDEVRRLALEHRPRILVAGYSAYPWRIDWKRFREIRDEVRDEIRREGGDPKTKGPLLLADISHPAGLVVADRFPSPLGVADVTMTTTHKTLLGPRGAILLTTDEKLARQVDMAVFPGEQGGPHVHAMAAKAVAFKIAQTDAFRQLQGRVIRNAQRFAEKLAAKDLRIAYGGTESHLFLVDLKGLQRSGSQVYPEGEVVSRILDLSGITCNKNTIAGDRSPLRPSGIRLGTTWITQQGFGDPEIDRLAELIGTLLGSIRSFCEPGAREGSGRIAFEGMQRVRAEVDELMRTVSPDLPEPLDAHAHPGAARSSLAPSNPLTPEHAILGGRIDPDGRRTTPASYESEQEEGRAAGEEAVLVDLFDGGLVRVAGLRARTFLQAALSAEVLALDPHEGTRGLLLGPDPGIRYDVTVLRLPDEEPEAQFVLGAEPEETGSIVAWLRSLSDGLVLADEHDPHRKLDGPVVVEDLRQARRPGARRARLLVLGPKAATVVARHWNGASGLEPGRAAVVEHDGESVTVFRAPDRGPLPCFELHVPLASVTRTWSSLLDAGGDAGLRAAGWHVLEQARLPVAGRPVEELARAGGDRFAFEKPFFVMQEQARSAVEDELPRRERYEPEATGGELRRTPLYSWHVEHTLRSLMAPFGGWEMPLWYSKVSEEHRAVREAAALFDVSHMGVLGVRGRDSARFLDLVTTNHVPRLRVGQSHYTYILDPDGAVLDDLIVYRTGEEDLLVVVNAANAERVLAWLLAVRDARCEIDRRFPERAVDARPEVRDLRAAGAGDDRRVDLALQGPRSFELLERLADPADAERIAALESFRHGEATVAGIPLIVSRTGYTGEACAYELFVHPDRALELWKELLGKGEDLGVLPAGLAARDSARTEAGLPLYGHELAGEHEIDPIEAGYGSFVKFDKPFFVGRRPLLERPTRGERRTVRFRARKGRRFEVGDPVYAPGGSGEEIGRVTSCSIAGDTQVGLALLSAKGVRKGTVIGIGSRRRGGEPRPVTVLPRFPRRAAEHGPLDPPMEDAPEPPGGADSGR